MPALLNTLHLAAAISAEEMSRAVEIAVTGMLIVFAALLLLTLFLTLLPRMLAVLNHVFPEGVDEHATPEAGVYDDEEDEILAAIGFVLHTDFRET